jgi:hypothetical protein
MWERGTRVQSEVMGEIEKFSVGAIRNKVIPMILNETHAKDVAAASASYTWNLIAEIAKLSPPEGFQRLCDLFHTAILAYMECQNGWGFGPDPSDN